MSSGVFGSPLFDEHAIEVYGWVLDNKYVDFEAVAGDLGISPDEASRAFERLVRFNVVRVGLEEGATVAWAVDPDAAALLHTRPLHEEIQHQQLRLDRLAEDFSRLRNQFEHRRHSPAVSIENISSLDEVRAALNRATAECREEMVTMQPGGHRQPEALAEAASRDRALLSRGVRMRTIYHHTARFNGPSQVYVSQAGELGAEYRTHHEVVGRMIIFDRHRLAFVPMLGDESAAVVTSEPSIVAFLHQVFEQFWAHAIPFQPAAPENLEEVAKEVDQTIIRLLSSGLKDEVIARRVGMSLRTTRRHIADIMRLLGAESRFQAGVLAAQSLQQRSPDEIP